MKTEKVRLPLVIHARPYAWASAALWLLICIGLWHRYPSLDAFRGSFFQGEWISIFRSWAGFSIPCFCMIVFLRKYRIEPDKVVLEYLPHLPFKREFPLIELESVEFQEKRNSSIDLVLIFRHGKIKIPTFFCGFKQFMAFLMDKHREKVVY